MNAFSNPFSSAIKHFSSVFRLLVIGFLIEQPETGWWAWK
jgi:hypothetical protein